VSARLLWQALAAAVGIAILIGLGVWQLQRAAWKEALIARVALEFHGPAQPAPPPSDWQRLDLAEWEYRPVWVTGRFLNDKEIYANATLTAPKGPRGGFGFFVMTPFQTDAGWIVYVNRGFVPREFKSPATRLGGEITGTGSVTGALRAPVDRAWFMPADDAARNEWFSRDPRLYAAGSGLPSERVASYFIDARFDPALAGGLPQGGETIVDFPNNHLGYAITWFGLAAGLAGVFGVYAWRQLWPHSALG
jgi:surfeit locus 1 family protein